MLRAKALRAVLVGVCLCLGAATAALAQSGDHATVVFDVTPTTAQVTTPSDTTPAPSDMTPRETPESTPDPDQAEQGEAVVVEAASGTVTVKQEGTDDFAELADGAAVPVGSLIDATEG